jgi:hypothetical protein
VRQVVDDEVRLDAERHALHRGDTAVGQAEVGLEDEWRLRTERICKEN